MNVLSKTFDDIDNSMIKVINKFHEHHSINIKSNCSELAYIRGNEKMSMEDALEKEHIHVYSSKPDKEKTYTHKTDYSDFLVPFHVDNGLYLIITPFPGHGMDVKISNGNTISTSHIGYDSAFVLIGRGLTDWLLSTNIALDNHIFSAPHSVPTLVGSQFETRTVYARMKIPDPSSFSSMTECSKFNGQIETFDEFFNSRSIKHLEPSSRGIPKKREADDLFAKTLENQCNEGEAYCWSICQTLPTDCNETEQTTCIDG